MKYEFPEAEKVETLRVLVWIAKREWRTGEAVCVYDLEQGLEDELGVDYSVGRTSNDTRNAKETKFSRMNDASQRLRMLCRSGYITKVSRAYSIDEPYSVSATACAKRIENRLAGHRGRRPEIYILTSRGRRYSASHMEELFLQTGRKVPRKEFMDGREVGSTTMKLHAALREDGTCAAFWAKPQEDAEAFAEKHGIENALIVDLE